MIAAIERKLPAMGDVIGHKVTFEEWRAILRSDCIAHDKLLALDNIGEIVLRLFYEDGTDPSVAAIISDGDRASESPTLWIASVLLKGKRGD